MDRPAGEIDPLDPGEPDSRAALGARGDDEPRSPVAPFAAVELVERAEGPPAPPRSLSGPVALSAPVAKSPVAMSAVPVRETYWTRRATRLFVLAILLALTWIVPKTVEQIQYSITRGQQRARADVARMNLASLSSGLTATSEAFRWVAQSVEPSVVHVDAIRELDEADKPRADEWSFFAQPRVAKGEGSGVIVDAEGYVVTNHHVIAGADRVDVHLADGRSVSYAQVVGSDPLTDLAVLKIGGGNLVAAPWGPSDELEVGDWVLAVGNPFGLDRSVTAGIISAKRERGAINNNPYQHFLQTDAAVNPGNSGGPLVNLRGQVVGINTQIVGQSFQGVSFAIPSDLAREVYDRLRRDGKVARGWLGVAQKELTPELAEQLGLAEPSGSLVSEVWEDSPAKAAGIRAGDVIVAWNGAAVESPLELSQFVASTPVGQEVEVELQRDGERQRLRVRVSERTVDDEARRR